MRARTTLKLFAERNMSAGELVDRLKASATAEVALHLPLHLRYAVVIEETARYCVEVDPEAVVSEITAFDLIAQLGMQLESRHKWGLLGWRAARRAVRVRAATRKVRVR